MSGEAFYFIIIDFDHNQVDAGQKIHLVTPQDL